jgi:hypothetical protein
VTALQEESAQWRQIEAQRRKDGRVVHGELRETRRALQQQTTALERLWRDGALVREQKLVEDRVFDWVARQVKRQRRLVFGPWTGEVGFELIYWVPFLRYVARRYELPPDRILVISRGGTGSWYADFASGYCDLFDVITPEALRQALRQKKQRDVPDAERRLLAAVRQRLGVSRLSLIHPLLMYRLFMPYWKETDSIRRVERFAVSGRVADSPPAAPLDLPDRFVAVRFYFSDCFPDTPANREVIARIIESLTARTDVVMLDPGFRIDDHADWPATARDRVHTLHHVMTASNNLGVQTAVIRRASGFVGTYGGFSYLAPLCGVDTVALFSERNFYRTHLERAARMLGEVGGGQLVPIDTRALEMIRGIVGFC